jgi:predicted GNAT family N-acyltransferase
LKIIEPYSPEDFKRYFNARWEILRKPWEFPKGSEIDDNENISLHIMAMENEEIVGVGRLTYFSSGQGQVRFNIGTEILEYLEKEAKKMGLDCIYLNARQNSYLFYSNLGYKAEGKPFDGFAGITHTKMVKKL